MRSLSRNGYFEQRPHPPRLTSRTAARRQGAAVPDEREDHCGKFTEQQNAVYRVTL